MSNWGNPGERRDGPEPIPQPHDRAGSSPAPMPPPQPGPPPQWYPQQQYAPQPPHFFVPQPPPPAAKPGVMSLRPQSVGEVLDVAFQTIKANPSASIGVSALCGLLGLALGAVIVASGGGLFIAADAGRNDVGVAFFIAAAVAGPLIMVLNLVSTGSLIQVFAQAVIGHRASLGEAFRTGFRRMWAALGLAVLAGLAWILVMVVMIVVIVALAASHANTAVIVLTVVLALFGGLALALFAVRFCFAFHIVVMEEAGPVTALRRSFRLTRGRFWRTLGILLLAYVVLSVVSSVLQFFAQFLSTGLLGASGGFGSDDSGQAHSSVGVVIGVFLILGILSVLVGAFTQPFMVNVLGTLYVDARIRDEGLAGALMTASASTSQAQGPSNVPGGQGRFGSRQQDGLSFGGHPEGD